MPDEEKTFHIGNKDNGKTAVQRAMEEAQEKAKTAGLETTPHTAEEKPPVTEKSRKKKKDKTLTSQVERITDKIFTKSTPVETVPVVPPTEQPQSSNEKSPEEKDAEYAAAYFEKTNSPEARTRAEEELIKEFYKKGTVTVDPKQLAQLGITSEEEIIVGIARRRKKKKF